MLSVSASSGRSLIAHLEGFALRLEVAPEHDDFRLLPGLHHTWEDVLDLRLIGNHEPVRMSAAEGEVVDGDEVIAVFGCDEIHERVFAGVVAVGRELLALGIAEQQVRVKL